jgi:hypothetical protein
MTRHQVRALLTKNHVELQPSGTARLVPLCEIREKMRWLFDSLVEAEQLRRAVG